MTYVRNVDIYVICAGLNLLSAVGVPKLIYRTGVVLDLPPERHTSPHHMYNYVQGAPDP